MRFFIVGKIVFIFILIIISFSCAREAYNISYIGVVVDEETNCPLPLSYIQSHCVFQQNIDESASQKLNTTTDNLGQFKLKFDKGYKIRLAVKAEDYLDQQLEFKPYSAQIPDTIYLKRKLVLQTSIATKTINHP